MLKPNKKILQKKKTDGNDKFLTTKSNILTAWKFLLLFYQFNSYVNCLIDCLIDLITKERKTVQTTNYHYK